MAMAIPFSHFLFFILSPLLSSCVLCTHLTCTVEIIIRRHREGLEASLGRAQIELEGREGGQQLAVIPALGKPVAYV